jgi:putative hemolysin
VIKVRIGKPITTKDQDAYSDLTAFSEFIRKKTYLLANPFHEKMKILSSTKIKIQKPAKEIITQESTSSFIKEVNVLRASDGRLLESKNYEVFFAKAKEIPSLLQEIGRLREITYRAVGEGTNKAIDLDKYDTYYYHLFLWDRAAKCLVGAYRMGLGKEIYKEHGIKGFYIQNLFRIEPELHQMMDNTIEMGRAFIIQAYQQKPMPLFLLWKGIVHVTLRYPEYKFLMGGVSISNQFSDFSKSLMIEFMKSHYYDPYVAQYIQPKKEYKVKLKDADKDFVFDATKADMQKFDKFIDEIEPGALRIPVLIKKYVKQNARLVAFNVDPKFNNAVDGLMYIKVADIPESTVKPVMEEFQAELERKATEGTVDK